MGSPLGLLASQRDGSMIAVFVGVMMAALPELLKACKVKKHPTLLITPPPKDPRVGLYNNRLFPFGTTRTTAV